MTLEARLKRAEEYAGINIRKPVVIWRRLEDKKYTYDHAGKNIITSEKLADMKKDKSLLLIMVHFV